MPDQVFSETDAAEIVKYAAKIQEQESSTATPYTPGVTKDELWRIAQEVGLSRDVFERAISEYRETKEPKEKARFRLNTDIERVVDGEIAPEDFDVLSDILRSKSSQVLPTQVGRTLSATVMTGGAVTKVAVTSRNGRTRMKLESSPVLGIVFGLQAALFGIIFGCLAAFENSLPILGAGIFMLGWILGALIFTGVVKGSRKAVKKLADDLEARLLETVTQTEATRASTTADVQARIGDSPTT